MNITHKSAFCAPATLAQLRENFREVVTIDREFFFARSFLAPMSDGIAAQTLETIARARTYTSITKIAWKYWCFALRLRS
jgi:hypothetical protein